MMLRIVYWNIAYLLALHFLKVSKTCCTELFASCPFSRLAEEDRSGILFTCDYSLFGLVFHVKGKYSIVSFDYS